MSNIKRYLKIIWGLIKTLFGNYSEVDDLEYVESELRAEWNDGKYVSRLYLGNIILAVILLSYEYSIRPVWIVYGVDAKEKKLQCLGVKSLGRGYTNLQQAKKYAVDAIKGEKPE